MARSRGDHGRRIHVWRWRRWGIASTWSRVNSGWRIAVFEAFQAEFGLGHADLHKLGESGPWQNVATARNKSGNVSECSGKATDLARVNVGEPCKSRLWEAFKLTCVDGQQKSQCQTFPRLMATWPRNRGEDTALARAVSRVYRLGREEKTRTKSITLCGSICYVRSAAP